MNAGLQCIRSIPEIALHYLSKSIHIRTLSPPPIFIINSLHYTTDSEDEQSTDSQKVCLKNI